TTLPTLDEILGLGIGRAEALDRVCRSLREDALNVFTLHAEVEGGPYLDVFADLLDRLPPTTLFLRLLGVARTLGRAQLRVCDVRNGMRAGRAGAVACQVD